MTTPAEPNTVARNLIVVGASAGGVEALSTLVASLPVDLPAAVVVAQHLDPARPSHLGDILARRTTLPVRTVERTEKLLAGTIYLVPSNRHVAVTDHEVSVHADPSVRPAPSVDLLLATAAQVFGERLIAVILTGSGSDGAAGAHAVKEAGGTVVIQDPATAAYPSMPRSLAAPLVDAVAPIERIGGLLGELLDMGPVAAVEDDLTLLLDRLRDRRGVDFSAYKVPTIQRRLRRRMTVAGFTALPAYLDFLDQNPPEEQRLVGDFLIKVTRFFRDAALFDELRGQVLPELLDAAVREGRELRLWSAGCATGEEAYSLAILAADLAPERGAPPSVRIFATDLDDAAVAFARRGIYARTALGDLPAATIARHFVEHEDGLEVRKELRALIVFGSHDLGQRPPFPNTDLVLCRNVLIYFTQTLQRRALDIFAYSLRDGGYLVLGKSETPGPSERQFTPVARRLRIYRRGGPRAAMPPGRLPLIPPRLPGGAQRSPAEVELALTQAVAATREAQLLGTQADDLVRRLPVGVVVVDRSYDIASINGAGRELLGIHGTAVGQDLIHLAQRVPSTALRAGIDAVGRSEPARPLDTVVASESATGEPLHLAVSCHPNRTGVDGQVESIIVLVTDVTAVSLARLASEDVAAAQREESAALRATTDRLVTANRQILGANRELTDTVDELREQTEELRILTATAQVSAEEIETLNEELQSTNEELETLHEEAQATVEELNVANEELQARAAELEELATTHAAERARLTAILAGMGDAVLVVDHEGRTLLANAAYRAMFEEGDAGTLVPADSRGVALGPAQTPRARAARGEEFRMEFTAGGQDGPRGWYEVIGWPLVEQGAGILVVRDITDRSLRLLQEEFLSWAGHELRTPLSVLQSYLQLAIRRAGPDADDRLHASLASALVQARRQATLIDELLDATRLRSGQLILRRTRLDLSELVRRVVEIGQVLATGQTIAVDAPGDPIFVDADPGRLEQVLLNLLTNAIAYARGTDRIDVAVRLCEGDGRAEVAVTDFGPGIDPEALGRIFERFGRALDKSGSHTGGLGLGLYIAREIVREHDGEIVVASTPGEGARFTVRLPLATAQLAIEPDSNHLMPVDAAADHVSPALAVAAPAPAGGDD